MARACEREVQPYWEVGGHREDADTRKAIHDHAFPEHVFGIIHFRRRRQRSLDLAAGLPSPIHGARTTHSCPGAQARRVVR